MKFPILLGIMNMMASMYFVFLLLTEKMVLLEVELFSLSSVVFSFSLIIDKVSVSFSVVVTIISFCVFTFACKYMEHDENFNRFMWILLSFVIAMNFLTYSGSFFMLLLGWDGLGITSFALIVYYSSKSSLLAGFTTLLANRIGDSLFVISFLFFILFGHLNYIILDWTSVTLLVLLMTLAAMTKSAQYPFCSWLPAAMAAPTPVSALVHSSTLVTAGVFVVIRFSYSMPLSEQAATILIFTGAVTSFLGSYAATVENDIKKVIALSTLSQLGIMMFCLGMGFPALALLHLYTHAFFKALLFLAAGTVLLTMYGVQDIRLLGGIGRWLPLPVLMINVSSLCLVGAPFMSAFFSKHTILAKMASSQVCSFSVVLMIVATTMTAKYVSQMLKVVSWSKPTLLITNNYSTNYVSIPLIVLGLFGISSGKILSFMDHVNMEYALMPSYYALGLYLIVGLGLYAGMTKLFDSKTFLLTSLLYLTPSFSFSSSLLAPVLEKISKMDAGWLEPASWFKMAVVKGSSFFSSFFMWPHPGSLIRVCLSLSVLFVFLVGLHY